MRLGHRADNASEAFRKIVRAVPTIVQPILPHPTIVAPAQIVYWTLPTASSP